MTDAAEHRDTETFFPELLPAGLETAHLTPPTRVSVRITCPTCGREQEALIEVSLPA